MKKEIGFIGLGRMGANMVSRMIDSKQIDVHVWNRSKEPVQKAVEQGAKGHDTVEDMIANLKQERKIVWIMLPSGDVTEEMFQKVIGLLNKNDIVIDGANSNFHDTLRRHKLAKEKGLSMLDIGVSGGIVAATRGYPMMIGGDKDTYDYVKPILDSFGIENGYDLVGVGGSGHYVKMIHNAIEYGMMQAIAEGFDLLKNGRFDLNLLQIAKMWNNGTIVDSFLMRMVEQGLEKDPELNELKPFVAESGEGKWATVEAIEQKVPFVVNGYALNARYVSQDENSLAMRMLASMRQEFGGHAVKK